MRRSLPFVVVVSWSAASHAEPARITFDDALGLAGRLPEVVALREVAAAERVLGLPRPWQPFTIQVTPQTRLAPAAARGVEGGVAVQQYVPLRDVNAARREA
ncbi:MAG: hypothetical protein KF773_33645, partial [Deltaproteobacteria bacterium]|nr:hypothetical protein [Deltaproteobacteria bacterium]